MFCHSPLRCKGLFFFAEGEDFDHEEGDWYAQDGCQKVADYWREAQVVVEDENDEVLDDVVWYVGNEEFDKAVNVLEEAQNIDMTNEELLKEILEILNEIDSDIAYEFLDRFIQSIGKDNISQGIKDILDSSNEVPSEPIADPAPGTYVNDISVKLKSDKMKIGHSYYYTLDGSHPNKGSNKYRGQIEISESTTIKLIGYNKNDESTEVITLEYIIDKNIVEDVKSSITEGENLIKDTTVGTEIGNISKKDKDKLQFIISESKDLVNKDSVSYDEVNNIKNRLESSIKEFENNIIKPVDKSKLKSAISEAETLYNNAVEGNSAGQYKIGSRDILLKVINNSKKINDNISSNQEEIDNQVFVLRNAITVFKNSKKTIISEKQAIKLIEDYFLKNRNFVPNSITAFEILNNQYYHIQVSDYPDKDEPERVSYGWFYVNIYTGDLYDNIKPPNISL